MYAYVQNNPLIYIDPSGHCFTEWLGKSYCQQAAERVKDGAQQAWDWTKQETELFWDDMVTIHSSWDTAVDYWTMGTLTQLREYYEISQENPLSLEQFLAAGMIVVEITPQGKTVKLTKKGTKFIDDVFEACNCFTASTKVLTDEGEKPIEDIEVGDKVLAKDDDRRYGLQGSRMALPT